MALAGYKPNSVCLAITRERIIYLSGTNPKPGDYRSV